MFGGGSKEAIHCMSTPTRSRLPGLVKLRSGPVQRGDERTPLLASSGLPKPWYDAIIECRLEPKGSVWQGPVVCSWLCCAPREQGYLLLFQCARPQPMGRCIPKMGVEQEGKQ